MSGAGSSDVNGCYVQKGSFGTRPLFVLDDLHELYAWVGVWHLGLSGKHMSYLALSPSAWPPESSGGCGPSWIIGSGIGGDPCPAS